MDVVINVCKARTLAHCKETDRIKKIAYTEVVTRDKANLKTVLLKDESLADTG